MGVITKPFQHVQSQTQKLAAFETVLKFYNLEARFPHVVVQIHLEFTVETTILILVICLVKLSLSGA